MEKIFPGCQQTRCPAWKLLRRLFRSEKWTVTEEFNERKETVKNAFFQDNLRINSGWLEFNNCIAEELEIVDLNAIIFFVTVAPWILMLSNLLFVQLMHN